MLKKEIENNKPAIANKAFADEGMPCQRQGRCTQTDNPTTRNKCPEHGQLLCKGRRPWWDKGVASLLVGEVGHFHKLVEILCAQCCHRGAYERVGIGASGRNIFC